MGNGETWTPTPDAPALCIVTNTSASGTYSTEQECAIDPLGTWDTSGTITTQSVNPYQFPSDEGANVGYYRGTAGVSVRVAPDTNVVVSGSYTKYKDPDFSTMTLKDLTRKMGSVGLRMNF
jgi:hypothetical protein